MYMDTKRLIGYGALTLVVLVILFYALNTYNYTEKQTNNNDAIEGVTLALEGNVMAINLEAMAVDGPGRVTIKTDIGKTHVIALPSMGILFCPALENVASPSSVEVGDRVKVKGERTDGGEIVPCADASHYFSVTGFVVDYDVAIGFPYHKGPGGYIIDKDISGMSTDPRFVTGYRFMLESDKTELENSTDAREGPPVILLRVYTNTDNLSPAIWAMRNNEESSIAMKLGETEEAVVGGANAIRYIADGLYGTETYVIAHGKHVYVFTANFIDNTSPMKRDMNTMLEALEFIPEKG